MNFPVDAATTWLLAALVPYVAVVLLGLLGYTPTLKKQILLMQSARPDSSEYKALAGRGTVLGIVLASSPWPSWFSCS